MLLVDDDQADVSERSEERRAGTHDNTCGTGPHQIPLVVALAGRKPRVQHGDVIAEAGSEAADGLWRERHLGYKHARRATHLDDILNRAQVDLRLARAGHAVEHDHRAVGPFVGGRDRLERVELTLRQGGVPWSRSLPHVQIALAPPPLHGDRAGFRERGECAGHTTQVRRKLGHAHRPLPERVEHGSLRRRVLASLVLFDRSE